MEKRTRRLVQSVLKKNNEELLRKVPSKIYEVILLWKKTKKNWIVNISEYHHRTMGLIYLICKNFLPWVLCSVVDKFDKPRYFCQYAWSHELRWSYPFPNQCLRICWIYHLQRLEFARNLWNHPCPHWPSQCCSSQHNEQTRCQSQATEAEEIAENKLKL